MSLLTLSSLPCNPRNLFVEPLVQTFRHKCRTKIRTLAQNRALESLYLRDSKAAPKRGYDPSFVTMVWTQLRCEGSNPAPKHRSNPAPKQKFRTQLWSETSNPPSKLGFEPLPTWDYENLRCKRRYLNTQFSCVRENRSLFFNIVQNYYFPK